MALEGVPEKKTLGFTLEGIFWIQRTGAPWRDLPAELGAWETIYTNFRRWTNSGLWKKIMSALRRKTISGKCEAVLIDATIVRAHQHAAGANGGKKIKLSDAQEVVFQRKYTSRYQKRDTLSASV